MNHFLMILFLLTTHSQSFGLPLSSNISKSKTRAQSAILHGGSEGTGGGDICESRIQNILADINQWIHLGGAKQLKLPPNTTLKKYHKNMTKAMQNVKIKCVGEKDKEFPVQINGTPKICKFTSSLNSNQFTCDFIKWNQLNETQQYVLIHHEIAGIAGIEKANLDVSDYQVSKQLEHFLFDQFDKKLAIKSSRTFLCESCSRFVKLKLGKHYYCGEFDPYIVGDACQFVGLDYRKNLYFIYDSAHQLNSDYSNPNDNYELEAGTNCALAEIYQTRDLIEKYGHDAFMTRIFKRIQCDFN